MLRLIFFVLLSIVYAREDTGYGQFEIIDASDNPMSSELGLLRDECISSERGAIFNYFAAEGVVTSFGTKRYLAVNERGYLVMRKDYQSGFLVSDKGGLDAKRFLKYNWQKTFKVCPNKRIGLGVNCEYGKEVFIVYSDFNEYR